MTDHVQPLPGTGGKFETDIGSATDGSAVEDLSDGLWAAFHQLARMHSKSLKKVYIMTNDPGPADDEAEHDQYALVTFNLHALALHVGNAGVDPRSYVICAVSTGSGRSPRARS